MRWLLTITMAALLLPLGSAADTLVLQDGRKQEVSLQSIEEGQCKLGQGQPAVALTMVKRIGLAPVGKPDTPIRVYMVGGDVLHAGIGTKVDRGVTLKSKLLGELRMKIQAIRLIDFGGTGKLPEEAADRDDLLYFINKQGKVGRLKGALESIGPEQIKFVWKLSGKTYTVPLAKVRGLRLARTQDSEREEGLRIRLTLTDGSQLSGSSLALDAKQAKLHHAIDQAFDIPRSGIARIDISSDWIIFLADVKPASSSTDRLYGAGKLLPVFRKNATIWGGSLAPYNSGIGTYATTRLTFQIRGRYKKFKSAVWVAELSRTAGMAAHQPQGEVIFRVYGDGRKLYDSGLVKVGSKPKEIDVDVTGVRNLTLEANRGPGWGVGDAACWGNPRAHK